MAAVVKHKFQSAKAQNPDNTLVSKNEWNDEHLFAGGSTLNYLMWDNAQSDKVVFDNIFARLPFVDITKPPYNAVAGANIAAVLQTAMNDLTQGGTIYFPKNNSPYLISTQVAGSSKIKLIGDGMGASVLKMTDAVQQEYIIKFTSKQWLTVEDLTFDSNGGNQVNNVTRGLGFSTCTDIIVRYCEFKGARNNTGSSTSNALTFGGYCQRYSAVFNWCHDCGITGQPSDGFFLDGRDFVVVGNRFSNIIDTAIPYNSNSSDVNDPDGNGVIANNIMTGCNAGIGILIVAGRYTEDIQIIGNRIRGYAASNQSGLYVAAQTLGGLTGVHCVGNTVSHGTLGKGILFDKVRDITFSGNRAYSNSLNQSEAGIYFLDCDVLVCNGNISRKNGTHGIILAGTTNFALTGNICKDNNQKADASIAGIRIGRSSVTGNDSNDGVIVGNYSTGATQTYGLSISDACTRIRVGDNNLNDNGTGGYINTSSGIIQLGDQLTDPNLETGGTATLTVTGFADVATVAVAWRVRGDMVYMTIPEINGTSNGSGFSLTNVPASITPARTRWQVIRVRDNGVDDTGLILYTGSSTTLNLYRNAAGQNWTAAGNKVMYGTTIAWPIY